MNRFTSLFIAASLAFSATAAAQDVAPTLSVERGTVMTSQGGEFANAPSGQALAPGERLMVTEQSSATVNYGKGCIRTYSAPGVYVIAPACSNAADSGTDWAGAATIAGGVLVTAAILHNMDQADYVPPPVSR